MLHHLRLFIILICAIHIGTVQGKKKGKERTIILGGGGGPGGGGGGHSHIVPIPIPYPIPVPMGQPHHHHPAPQIHHVPQSQPQIILVPTYQPSYQPNYHHVDHGWSQQGMNYDGWNNVQYLGHIGSTGHFQGGFGGFGKRK